MRIFRHYKGGLYEYLCEARHSETEEEFVVYRPLYHDSGVWVRPKKMFYENVTVNGEVMPRFEEVTGTVTDEELKAGWREQRR